MFTHLLFAFLIFFMNMKAKLGKKTRLTITFWILFFFCAFRYEFGNDYRNYMMHFTNVKDGYTTFKREMGYQILNQISPNFYIMIAGISAVMLFIIYRMIVQNVEKKYYGIAVAIWLINPYLFLVSLSAIRQTIACVCFIIAVNYAYKRRLLMYVAWILIASLFHVSALVLLPVYFFANDRKIGQLTLLVYCGIVLMIIFSKGFLANVINQMIGLIDRGQYYSYLLDANQNSVRATLLSLIYFIYIIINVPKLKGRPLMAAKLYTLGLTCSLLAYQISMMTRWQQYFDMYSLAAIPGIIQCNLQDTKQNKLMRVVNVYVFPILMAGIYILRYYSFFMNDTWKSFRTYKTILEVIL